MRALIGGGKTWQLRDIDSPSHLGAIRIQVMAAGIDRADLYALDGSYTAKSQQSGEFTAGMEVAGIVETSSPLAPHLRAGTRVMGITVAAFADYALCDPRLLVPIPDGLSFEQAATLPVGLITEHDALVTQAGFTVGNSVLIVGGTSSIGLVGIQLAKALGAATVIATTTSEEERDALTAAGADVTVNTTTEDLAELVSAATGGTGVDITLDHVGGDLFVALPAATAIGGTIVSIGRLAGAATSLNLDTIAFRRQRLLGTTFSIRTRAELAEVVAALTSHALTAVAAGKVRSWLDTVFIPENADEAAERLRGHDALGKIVLSFAATHPGSAPAPAQPADMFGTIRQIGYVVRDIEASMRGFVDSGIGPWFYLKGLQPGNFTYRGEPSGMVMDVAVANSGDIQIELISPVNDEPSMYKDFLDAGHEGTQHFACWNENYQDLYDPGFTVGQEGEIGGATGRFAYLETEHHPGTVVEISDFGGTKKFVFDFIELAAANWDGTNPIQVIDPALLSGDPAVMDEMKAALGG
ncbi:zinc-binding dehydrogenase [Nocardia noduli]|uniref:zinc-binding dehydrogenase n=1 Tax=Nocardia noduli TaxID=2815722 RepID=UPI001C238BA7|nr:zinc-binding dehydrogenase [Nocardia noduli]